MGFPLERDEKEEKEGKILHQERERGSSGSGDGVISGRKEGGEGETGEDTLLGLVVPWLAIASRKKVNEGRIGRRSGLQVVIY